MSYFIFKVNFGLLYCKVWLYHKLQTWVLTQFTEVQWQSVPIWHETNSNLYLKRRNKVETAFHSWNISTFTITIMAFTRGHRIVGGCDHTTSLMLLIWLNRFPSQGRELRVDELSIKNLYLSLEWKTNALTIVLKTK